MSVALLQCEHTQACDTLSACFLPIERCHDLAVDGTNVACAVTSSIAVGGCWNLRAAGSHAP